MEIWYNIAQQLRYTLKKGIGLMKYLNFYNRIQNPLDEEKVLEELISAYSEGHGFYSELTKRNSKNKPRRYNPPDCDDLHAFLFNTWKKEMLSITREQYEQAIKDKLYDNDIFKFVRYLSTVPDVKTKKKSYSNSRTTI